MSQASAGGAGSVGVTIEDGIAWIVLDNPTKRNALTAGMYEGLRDAAARLTTDQAVRVAVIRGAGDEAFCAGADITMLHDDGAGRVGAPVTEDALGGYLGTIAVPTIAMVHGYCLGGGVGVALAADIRLCADDAVFAIPAATFGVAYPATAVARLTALVGPGSAAEILFASPRIDGREAERIGLVNRCVPRAELESAVRAMAEQIAAAAPLSHRAHKLAIRATVNADTAAATDAIRAVWASDDSIEGPRAFRERRPPRFTGA